MFIFTIDFAEQVFYNIFNTNVLRGAEQMEKNTPNPKDEKIYKLLELFSKLPEDKKSVILDKATVMFQETSCSSQSENQSDFQ